ncbi:hypothetical protein BASA81_001059 [Batrachochytrium salamandrivorans]|nr:hypothetical protein BASA81_001059 [Batrachochytrium salamandrivorans]
MQRNPNTFSDRAAPANYVSGLGRGANSFQTSAQHGTVSMPSFGSAPSGYVPGMGRGSGGFGDKKPDAMPGAAPDEVGGGGRFDPLLGYESSFFNSSEYGTEDQYADAVYSSVDEMRSQKKRKPATVTATTTTTTGGGFKSIADDFADLKPGLKQVSVEDWGSLPEIATSLRNKKKKQVDSTRFTPITDSLLATMANRHNSTTSGSRGDLTGLSQARDQMLRVNLDRAGDGIQGQTNVDPRGFLTELSGQLDQSSQLGDVKKARLLLKSVTATNPSHGPGWIAAARVEEFAGKLNEARETMMRACLACPDQEDVWLEASRLEPTNTEAKSMLYKAVTLHLPKSVNLWLAAADLEITMTEAGELVLLDSIGSFQRRREITNTTTDGQSGEFAMRLEKRKQLVNQALGRIPNSAKLWQQAIAMEIKDADAQQQLVIQAKQACPDSVDFYLCQARLEVNPQIAQKHLNDARKRFPGEIRIWIAACRLVEEQNGSSIQLAQIVSQAMIRIAAAQAHVDRQVWLTQAEQCEVDAYPNTCEAILRQSLGMGIDLVDRFPTWKADAQSFASHNFPLCARVCLEILVDTFADSKEAWDVRIRHSTSNSGEKIAVLRRAVTAIPTFERFWLMLAKETWKAEAESALGVGGLQQANAILIEAFKHCPDAGEELWFAAATLANEVSAMKAREVFAQAREACGNDSERVWIKSIVHERRILSTSTVEEETLCRLALTKFPKSDKLHLMLGQVLELANKEAAKQIYIDGTIACPRSVPLWLSLARVEEESGNLVRARAVLDSARAKLDTAPMLWLAAIRLERRANSPDSIVQNYIARALQHFPSNGMLFVEQVETAPEAKKQSQCELAFKKTMGKDSAVVLCCAKLWWRKRPLDVGKVKKWLERAVSLDPKLGDAWATYYRFSQEVGNNKEEVIKRCIEADPTRGEWWIQVRKLRGNENLTTEQVLLQVAKMYGGAEELLITG